MLSLTSTTYNSSATKFCATHLADQSPLMQANFKTFTKDLYSVLMEFSSKGGFTSFESIAEQMTRDISHSTLRQALCDLNPYMSLTQPLWSSADLIVSGGLCLTRFENMKRTNTLQLEDCFAVVSLLAKNTNVPYVSGTPLLRALFSDEASLPLFELSLSTPSTQCGVGTSAWLDLIKEAYSALLDTVKKQCKGVVSVEYQGICVTMLIATVLGMCGFKTESYSVLNGGLCVTSSAFGVLGLQPITSLFPTKLCDAVRGYLNSIFASLGLWFSPAFELWYFPSRKINTTVGSFFGLSAVPYAPESFTQMSDLEENSLSALATLGDLTSKPLAYGTYFLVGAEMISNVCFDFVFDDMKIVPVLPKLLNALHIPAKRTGVKPETIKAVIVKPEQQAVPEGESKVSEGGTQRVSFSELSEIVGNKVKKTINSLETDKIEVRKLVEEPVSVEKDLTVCTESKEEGTVVPMFEEESGMTNQSNNVIKELEDSCQVVSARMEALQLELDIARIDYECAVKKLELYRKRAKLEKPDASTN